jgi:hypothetical protein
MKTTDAPTKPYDAIEDAIDMAKKDPTKTWDDLLQKTPPPPKPPTDKGQAEGCVPNQKIAANSAEPHRLYRVR